MRPIQRQSRVRKMLGGPDGTCSLILRGDQGGEIIVGYDIPLSLADPIIVALDGVLRLAVEAQGMDNLNLSGEL